MIEIASAKVGDAAELASPTCAELPVFGEFDLVWCLDDAINYLLTSRSWSGRCRDAAQPRPGGLLMFDANTIRPTGTSSPKR